MPTNLDFALYLNIAFFSMLGLGMLFGALRGMKKAMYSFVITLIFYVIFFFTIDLAVNFIWNVTIPGLGGYVSQPFPELANITKLSQALPIMIQKYLGSSFPNIAQNADLLEFATGLALFVVKLLYTIIYFTIIQLIYRLIFFIVRIIIFSKNKKTEKYKSQNRAFGAMFGLLSGAMSLFVTLIIFGGIMDIGESFTSLLPAENNVQTMSMEFPRRTSWEPDQTLLAIEVPGLTVPTEVDDAVALLNDMITSYNNNYIVRNVNTIVINQPSNSDSDDDTEVSTIPLNLYLFDDVLSINIADNKIAIRKELGVYTGIAARAFNSEFLNSGNLADISSEDITYVFSQLSQSDLISTILPLAIELGSENYDLDVTIPDNIVWKDEVNQIGVILSTAFTILEDSNALDASTDLKTVTLDAGDVEDLFDSLGDSKLVTLAAYVAIEPILESAGTMVQSLITVPADVDEWSDEFKAFGSIASAVISSGATLGDFESGDPLEIIKILSDVDFTVLLDSKIVTNAMINVLSGNSELDLDLSVLEIPDDIVWLDTVDGEGNPVNGELRNILTAVNVIVDSVEDVDLANLSITDIKDLDTTKINQVFESRILVATITKQVKELDLGEDFPLVIPDSVFDSDGYIMKTELENIVNAIHMAANELACDSDDTACQDVGFDIANVMSLTSGDIDTLLSSDILAATIGSLVIDLGSDVLTVPNSVIQTIQVDAVDKDIVDKTAIKNVFLAVSTLGISDINNIEIDATILTNLATADDSTVLDQDKADLLFGSKIINATLSKYLLDFTTEADAFIVVPYFDVDDNAVRVYSSEDDVEYISQDELTNVLKAILALDIQDFNSLDSLDLGTIILNSDKLLDSAILHATISKQIFDLSSDVITVPYFDEDDQPIRLTVGTDSEATEYIDRTELENAFDALDVIGITDINNFDGNIDISDIISDPDSVATLLDSAMIQAAVSEQVLDLTTDGTIVIPYYEDDGVTLVRKVVGTDPDTTEYIAKTELNRLIEALNTLGLTDVDSFSSTFDFHDLAQGDNAETVAESSIVQATVSKQVIDLSSDGTIVVPLFAEDKITPVKITVGADEKETVYVSKDEIVGMIHALDALGITGVDGFSGSVDLSVLSDDEKVDKLLESSSIQATISKQIIDMDDIDDSITVPYLSDDNQTEIRIETGPLGEETEYVKKTEIKKLIDAMNILGFTDVENFSGSVDLHTLAIGTNAEDVLASDIIQATVSKQVLDLDAGGTITVPYLADDDSTLIRKTVGTGAEEFEYVTKTELEATIIALDKLNITDVTTYSGGIDLTTFYDPDNRNILLKSSTMQATISKQVLDLGSDVVTVPDYAVDGVTKVLITVDDSIHQNEYLAKTEIHSLFEAMEILGITDITSFDGSVSLTKFFASQDVDYDTNQDILLASAAMHATITKQITDLGSAILTVPSVDSSGNAIETTVQGTFFLYKSEIKHLINAMDILGINDITSFDGSVSLTAFFASSDPNYDTNQDILLASAAMHATITKQITDLGSAILTVPTTDINGLQIILDYSGDSFITKAEIKNIINALDVLEITDITSFDGTVSLTKFTPSDPDYVANQNQLLASASMQATITKQITDLGSTIITVPTYDVDDVQVLKVVSSNTFITNVEIKNLFNAMDILGISDITTFDGSVSLSSFFKSQEPTNYDANQDTLLNSALMHATITKQITDLGDTVLRVPSYDVNNLAIKVVATDSNNYIVKSEIKNIINAMDILNITDITSFNGTITLNKFFESVEPANYDTNQDILLASASMHSTITKQINDLGSSILAVPTYDIDNVAIKLTATGGNNFISKAEIKHMINAMDVLGISNITNFDGTIDLTNISGSADQTTVLASASMHKTITNKLINLDDAVLIVPMYSSLGETSTYEIRKTVNTNEFIVKSEIKAIINAFIDMGYTDLSNFGGSIDSSKFFSNTDLYLLSASIHATLSDKLLNDTGGNLYIPDYDINENPDKLVRIVQSDVTYVELDETKALMDALQELGLTNFSAISISPTNVFASDFSVLLASASMQATISETLIDGALDDSAPAGSGKLIIPNYFRQDIAYDTVGSKWIEKTELENLLTALNTLNVSDFSGSIDASVVTSLTDAQLDTVLSSGSMQVTIDNMLKGNANINTKIPNLAQEDVFDMTNITTKTEIKDFIKATNIISSGSDITNVSIDLSAVTSLSTGDRDIVLNSMIIRNILTEELATTLAGNPDTYYLTPSLYETGSVPPFYTKVGINDVFTHYGLV